MSTVPSPRGTSASAKLQGFQHPAELSPTNAPAAGLATGRRTPRSTDAPRQFRPHRQRARRLLGLSQYRRKPCSSAPATTRWVAQPRRRFRAVFSTAPPRGRPLGPTGDRGSGLVRRASGDQTSVVVAGPAGARCKKPRRERKRWPMRRENGPKSRQEKPGSGGRQFEVVNKVYSKQRGS